MTVAYDAMLFARQVHATQRRKYTNNPYVDHLAEVAAIAASVGDASGCVTTEELMATAWLHDCMEDQGIVQSQLTKFGENVLLGVLMLSDLETGNRAQRKAASRQRLAGAPGWVQTIKCADLISNTSSIIQHDPKFAAVYLEEKRLLLQVLTRADQRLLEISRAQTNACMAGQHTNTLPALNNGGLELGQ